MLAFMEQIFWEEGSLPTDEVIAQNLGYEKVVIASVRKRDNFKAALKKRGIEADMVDLPVGSRALNPMQIGLANIILNTHDKRTMREKLKTVNVSMQQFQAWLRQPAFRQYLQKRTEAMFEGADTIAYQNLIDAVSAGDLSAIKLFFEMRGIYNPKVQVSINVEAVIVNVVEIVSKYVTPETLHLIAGELEQVMAKQGMKALSGG